MEKYLKKLPKNKRLTNAADAKITVKVKKNKITIAARFKYSGNLAFDNKVIRTGVSYKSLVAAGIKEYWDGSYTVLGYNVKLKTKITEVKQGQGTNAVMVNMYDGVGLTQVVPHPDGWSKKDGNFGTMYLYKHRVIKNSTNVYTYPEQSFKWTCAHEFGHHLGLKDASQASKNNNIISIMHKRYTYAQSGDVERVLLAFMSNKKQSI